MLQQLQMRLRETWDKGVVNALELVLRENRGQDLPVNELLELVVTDLLIRKDRGETTDLAEYQRRFPQLREKLASRIAEELDEPPGENSESMLGDTRSATGDPIEATKANQPLLPPAIATPSNAPAVDPRSFGPYELLEKLGQGGMGAVYKARHKRLDKIVAIKLLPAHLTNDPAALSRFDREMRAVGKLDHPGIVRAMDAGETNGRHYLAMEFVDGQDLQRLVQSRGKLPIAEACALLRQAALALDYAHQRGLIHRDIKPSNLLLARDGQLKVLDLGLARLTQEEGQQELTNTGQSLGTPDYMAPEQWEDTHSVDHRCDLYALGCTLFYLLTGYAPYSDENRRTIVNKMKGHLAGPIPDLRAKRADVPSALAELCASLLAKRPADRPDRAITLAERLTPFCQSESPGDSAPNQPTADGAWTKRGGLSDVRSDATRDSRPESTNDDDASRNYRAAKTAAEMPTAPHSLPLPRRPTTLAWIVGAASLVLFSAIVIKFAIKDRTAGQTKVTDASNRDLAASAPAPSPPQAPIDFAAERQAAEWALSIGATVELVNQAGGPVSLANENGKLREEPFALKSMAVYSKPSVTDDELDHLRGCRRLQSLLLFGTSITGSGLSHLRDVQSLTDLDLSTSAVSDEGLVAVSAFPRLRSLNLTSNRAITDAGLAQLRSLTQLETLWLDDLNITDDGVRSLSEFRGLRRLYLNSGAKLTDVGVAFLVQQNRGLEILSLANTGVSHRTLLPVANANHLRTIIVTGDQLSSAGIDALKPLAALRSLEIRTPLNADELGRVPQLTQLTRLSLRFVHGDSPSPGDEVFAALARLPNLRELVVEGNEPSPDDRVLEAWAAMPQLESLTLQHGDPNRRYTPEGILKFRKARPDVELNIDGKSYSDR